MAESSLLFSLKLVQFVVNAFLSHELIMSASLNNFSLTKHSNAVGIMNSRQAMGYDNGGTSPPCFFQGLLDNLLTFCV